MRRVILRLAFVVDVGAAVVLLGSGNIGWGVVVLLGAVALAVPAFRCFHPGPLGLLPPVTLKDGTRTPARWFCDRCGTSWPANFDREHRPIPRFEGYDESKATHAAKRADDLYKRQHAMAVKRAGYTGRREAAARPPVEAPDRAPAEVVSLRRAK